MKFTQLSALDGPLPEAPEDGAQTLEKLCADWLRAKTYEANANNLRILIEEQIVALTGKKDEGAKTVEADGFKLTITGKVSRKMDWDKWNAVKAQIPAQLHPVKFPPELDEKGVKYLKLNEPAIYALLPLEVKPAKTAVDVKTKEVEKA